jgi:phosphoenolpyruvate-protein phosphotransferase
MREIAVTVNHQSGLHARPAALLVQLARRFKSDVVIASGSTSAPAKSILGVLSLGVKRGARVVVRADGEDEHEAVESIRRLVASNFGERPEPVLGGYPASPGIAIGPVFRCCRPDLSCESATVADRATEAQRFTESLDTAREQLSALHSGMRSQLGDESAAILGAQELMLEDPELRRMILGQIESEGSRAECAVRDAAGFYARRLDGLEDPYLRLRAADVRDVGDRLLRVLLGVDENPFADLNTPSVVVAENISPSEVALLDRSVVLGFVMAEGGPTSHAAILARAMGVPAVVGVGDDVLAVSSGTLAILDGSEGVVIADPDAATLATYRRTQAELGDALAEAQSHALEPAVTREGRRIEILANIGSEAGAAAAVKAGAGGIGLLRTEFLYLGRRSSPGEEEQYRAYSAVFAAAGEMPIILRTLDLGSDKEAAYLALPREANPFLGLRGIRLGLARPDMLRQQLRAALRAGAGRDVRILFPLVATVDELVRARAALDESRVELMDQGHRVNEVVMTGAMIEVPAAAMLIDQLAAHVDFFSIGTNDLAQYVMAADRTNAAVASLVTGFQPAVLRMVASVISEAHAHDKPVGLCGELAGQPAAIPILLGLGLDDFSMSPPAIPVAKQILRGLSMSQAKDIAQTALGLGGPQQVLEMVHERVPATRIGGGLALNGASHQQA